MVNSFLVIVVQTVDEILLYRLKRKLLGVYSGGILKNYLNGKIVIARDYIIFSSLAFVQYGPLTLQERLDIIEAQLAHQVKDTLGRAYNRTTFLKERRELMNRWGKYLDGLKAGEKVIPLHKKGA